MYWFISVCFTAVYDIRLPRNYLNDLIAELMSMRPLKFYERTRITNIEINY